MATHKKTLSVRALPSVRQLRAFVAVYHAGQVSAAAEAIAYAERALAELEAMVAGMAELAGARRGRLRIAATSTVAQTLLPAAMREFLAAHPDVKVEIEDVAPSEFV